VPIKSITCESHNDKFVYLGSKNNSKNSENNSNDANNNDDDDNNDNGNDDDVEPGPAFTRLLSTLRGIQLGKLPDSFGWCDVVEEPPREFREAAATAAAAAATPAAPAAPAAGESSGANGTEIAASNESTNSVG
jgi:hypothetical protein